MSKDISGALISGESEDYTIDDVITIGGLNQNKPISGKSESIVIDPKLENNSTNSKELENVEETMKDLINNLSETVSPNINKFVSMTECEEKLKSLYSHLQNLSQNRGSAKEIIQIGSSIQVFEEEKSKQNISDTDINQTIENIKNAISVLGKFKNMLELNKNK